MDTAYTGLGSRRDTGSRFVDQPRQPREPQQAARPALIDLDTDYDYAMDMGEDFWNDSGIDEDER